MKISQIILLMLFIGYLVGCSSQDMVRMSSTEKIGQYSTYKTIRVNPVNGKDTLDQDLLELDLLEFKKALGISLQSSGLFSSVTTNDSDHILDAEVILQGFQTTGFGNVTSILEVNYKVTEITPTASIVVFKKDITTACKKTGADHFGGQIRIVRSLECSASDNIKKFLIKLSNKLKDRH